VDGEKDPRCLLLSFEAVQYLLHLYHQQPEESLCHDRLEVRGQGDGLECWCVEVRKRACYWLSWAPSRCCPHPLPLPTPPQESAEELFEVLACYFPITFTPPPNDPNK